MSSTVAPTRPPASQEGGRDEAAYGPERFAPLHLLRTTPTRVWLLTALFGLVLASWSVLVPQYHAPDEPNHTDAVMRLVQGEGWPRPGTVFVTPDGVGAIVNSPYGSREQPYDLHLHTIPAQDATDRADRPSWRELGAGQPPGNIQQIVQHPPLYYWLDATILRLLPGGGDALRWDIAIGTLRLLSVLMVIPLPFLAYHGARRLTGDENAATVAAVFPLAVPQLTHIGSTVNNDNLLIMTAGMATVAIVYVLRGDTSLRTAAYTGAFVGLALFTKSLAIVFVPMAVVAYLLAWRRARRAAKAAVATSHTISPSRSPSPVPGTAGGDDAANTPGLPGTPGSTEGPTDPTRPADPTRPTGTAGVAGTARHGDAAPFLLADAPAPAVPAAALRFPWRQMLLGGTLALALGGWWWVVNLVRYQVFQPETPGFLPGKYLGDSWNAYLAYLANRTVGRWWGEIGWFEANLPVVLAYSASAAVAVLFVLGVVRARGWQARTDLMVLFWPTWASFGLMTYQATTHFADTLHVTGIAGRYTYVGFVALVIGVGAGVAAVTSSGSGTGTGSGSGNAAGNVTGNSDGDGRRDPGPVPAQSDMGRCAATRGRIRKYAQGALPAIGRNFPSSDRRNGRNPPVGGHLGTVPRRRPVARWMPLLFFVVAVAMQAYTASLVMRHFWRPAGGGTAQAWDAMAAWSPWSPTTLTTLAWLTAATAVAALAACVVHGARRPRPYA